MAENKKVQIKNTGGDALYPRTAAESIVNVPGGTMNVFMYINGPRRYHERVHVH